MVIDLPIASCRNDVCSECELGKHYRDNLTNVPLGTPQPLCNLCTMICAVHFHLLHSLASNICLTFIDDYSRRSWVYFLKLKSEVFDMFMAYKDLVEKQFGCQLLKLRYDNGGEYVNNKFTTFCTAQVTQMQHTVSYTPQQNGVAQSKNRTLKEMANYMIQAKGLRPCFSTEAINCANYRINCTPTKALKNITSKEAWSSIKLDVSHFYVFGSEAWAHIPDEKQRALEPKSEKCISIGYSEDFKGYRFLQQNSTEIIIKRC